MRLILLFFAFAMSSVSGLDSSNCNAACSCEQICNVCQIKNVTVVCLQGTHNEMGLNYGRVLRTELSEVLGILKDYYINQQNYTYAYLESLTTFWHYRYSFQYQSFIQGMAVGANLTLSDAKILNGMVIYGVMNDWNACPGGPDSPANRVSMLGGCAYAYIPPRRSATGSGFAARNYDFPYPFYIIAKYIVVTILVEANKIPTAIVSMPGQIYCQNCINANGIFMELNNGGPSGGFCINPHRHGLLIGMLEFMQNSESFWQLDYQLRSVRADVALIVNAATGTESKSYEFTAYIGQKTYQPSNAYTPLVATNFFQNSTWTRTLAVTDNTCWQGITRRNNILRNIQQTKIHTLESVKNFWVKSIGNGGAVWNDTVYQLIYDTFNQNLHVRSVKHGGLWVPIPLKQIFSTVPAAIFTRKEYV